MTKDPKFDLGVSGGMVIGMGLQEYFHAPLSMIAGLFVIILAWYGVRIGRDAPSSGG